MKVTSDVLAAIDVGTNSFHLVVAKVTSSGRFEILTRDKETVRLGRGGGDMKLLDPEAAARGIDVLARMRRIAEGAGATVRAVATSAVREASNGPAFMERARREAGIEIEVVSGVEEARLIHLGVLHALPVFEQRLIVCDIGGGSTEVVLGLHDTMIDARSFKLGAVRLTDRFFPTDRVQMSEVAGCRDYVRSTIAPFARTLRDSCFDVVAASSGTAEAVARLARRANGIDEPRSYNGIATTTADVSAMVTRLAGLTPRQRSAELDVDPKRADIILAGAIILDEVLIGLGATSFVFSEAALREGILLDTIARLGDGTLHHLRDVSRASVRHLLDTCDDEPAHAGNVSRLALQLFDALHPLHGYDTTVREYLEAGALLANVGLLIGHNQHHRHSYYIIRNSEALTGFTSHETEIVALLARYHRKSAPKLDHGEFAVLDSEDRRLVQVLSGLLRVAIGLDRRHDGRVELLSATIRVDRIELSLHAAPGTDDLTLERYAANERSALLADVLGRKVVVK